MGEGQEVSRFRQYINPDGGGRGGRRGDPVFPSKKNGTYIWHPSVGGGDSLVGNLLDLVVGEL